jgi:type IV pilus assembly protein PilB
VLEKKLETFLLDQLKKDKGDSSLAFQKLLDEKKKTGKRFVDIVPTLERISQVELLKALGDFYQIPFVDLEKYNKVDQAALKSIPEKLIRHFRVFPIGKMNDVITVAMMDPTDVVLVDRLGQYAKCEVTPVFAAADAIDRSIERFLGPLDTLGQAIRKMEGGSTQTSTLPTSKREESAPSGTSQIPSAMQTVYLVNLIVEKAIASHASDIHLEPSEKVFYVRYRVDGVLYDYAPLPPKAMEASIISRLKIMANLDIAEKRLPQDGRIQFRMKDRDVNLRISTFPTIYGENVVIRVLDRSDALMSLEEIGLEPELLEKVDRAVAKTSGIILVTGPTGSGKTTTLYGALSKINTVERHIITLEDPVEYRMERIRQSQVDPKSGLTFARGLRSIMRQDPDVIMVGEIRDLETAQIAIQAALTGHLVLSTLHTNDAPSAITRLLDMGVEPFLISSSVNCVVAQRLIRTLCQNCRQPHTPEQAFLKEIGFPFEAKSRAIHKDHIFGEESQVLPEKYSCKERAVPKQFYKRVGCDRCKETGFSGRIGIFEVMIPEEEIRKLIVRKESAEIIKKTAVQKGMRTLKEDGLLKAERGLTTIDEVLRVAQDVI